MTKQEQKNTKYCQGVDVCHIQTAGNICDFFNLEHLNKLMLTRKAKGLSAISSH